MLIMKIIRLLSAILCCCTLVSNITKVIAGGINDVLQISNEFYPTNCTITCNDHVRTIEYNQEPQQVLVNEINNFIGNNYFNVNEFHYNAFILNCAHVNDNMPCMLTIKNLFKNDETRPAIRFDGGTNEFYGIQVYKFYPVICSHCAIVGNVNIRSPIGIIQDDL